MAGSSGTRKKKTESNLVWEQPPPTPRPPSCYLNGALGGLAFWPWSLCCQHIGRFVCDFIRNQNNSQMKRKIAYAKCCRNAGAVCALNTHSHSHTQTASQEDIKHSITAHIPDTNTRSLVDKRMNVRFLFFFFFFFCHFCCSFFLHDDRNTAELNFEWCLKMKWNVLIY